MRWTPEHYLLPSPKIQAVLHNNQTLSTEVICGDPRAICFNMHECQVSTKAIKFFIIPPIHKGSDHEKTNGKTKDPTL